MTASERLPPPPVEEGIYQVYSMCFARGVRRVHDNFIFRDMHDGPMPLDYNLWILRGASKTLLVDTGFGPRASEERGRPLLFDPIEGLKAVGIDPDCIEDILITHLHYDHAGNIDRFGRARFHIQDDEVGFATGRCVCDEFVRIPFDVEDVVTLIRRLYADRVVFHDGDVPDFMPGLELFGFPGHSARILGVRVQTERGAVLLASDASHYFANVLNMKPFMLTLDATATLASYRRLLAVSGGVDRLIPGHDPKLRRLYPAISVNGIELLALHEVPESVDFDDLADTATY